MLDSWTVNSQNGDTQQNKDGPVQRDTPSMHCILTLFIEYTGHRVVPFHCNGHQEALCRIWGSHSHDHDEFQLNQFFRGTHHFHLHRQETKEETYMKQAACSALLCKQACYLLHAGFLLGLFFDREDGGNMFLQNAGWHLVDYTVLCARRQIFQEALCDKYGLNHMGNRMKSVTTVVNFTGSCALNKRQFKVVYKRQTHCMAVCSCTTIFIGLDAGMCLTDLSSVWIKWNCFWRKKSNIT
jgi:hypothetical protein